MRVLVVQHEDGTGPALVGERLAAGGADVDLRHPWRGDTLPGDLSGHDALIVLGGSQAAYEEVRWFPEVFELLREAVRRDVPTLAICLGAQLLAVACGGEVRRAATAEVGRCSLSSYPNSDVLFDALPAGVRTVQWHYDEISVLPDGAVPLMRCDDGFPHQAYRMGSRVWAVQFHPEVLSGLARQWAASEEFDLMDPERMLAEIEAADAELRTVWGEFADRWLALAAAASVGADEDVRSLARAVSASADEDVRSLAAAASLGADAAAAVAER